MSRDSALVQGGAPCYLLRLDTRGGVFYFMSEGTVYCYQTYISMTKKPEKLQRFSGKSFY